MILANSHKPFIQFWVEAEQPTGQGIFSFSEYLAALALLLVVVTISDFRYRLRLSLSGKDSRRTAFYTSAAIGFGILATDFWFHNQLPVPFFLNSATNIKAILGLLFLAMLLSLIYTVFLDPPKYDKSSAVRFAQIAYQLVGEGNPSRIQTFLGELEPSLPKVFELAARLQDYRGNQIDTPPPEEVGASHDMLLLLADPRACAVVAKSNPWFAVNAVRAFKSLEQQQVPFSGFLRNVSRAFFRDKGSSIYLERSGYDSGLMGYVKQVSTELFGDFGTVEKCATDGSSPFDLDYVEVRSFDGEQAEAFRRSALIFFESYLEHTQGRTHSYAIARLFRELDSLVHGLERLNEPAAREWPNPEEERLKAVVDFIRDAMTALEESEIPEKARRVRKQVFEKDPYDYVAELLFELIFKSTLVKTSDFVTWSVQHNSIWSRVFMSGNRRTESIIRKRVFRLMYDEIKRMNEFPNFKGARILAYSLNVLGLNPGSRHESYATEDYPLRKLAHDWIKANYRNLLENHPKVAEACLTFRIQYDPENHRLVKTFSDETRKEPRQTILELD